MLSRERERTEEANRRADEERKRADERIEALMNELREERRQAANDWMKNVGRPQRNAAS